MSEKIIKLSIQAEENKDRDMRVIARDMKANTPTSAPYLEEGTELVDPETLSDSPEAVDLAWGGRPNVPASNVVNAIRRDIGARGYDLHISDGSYTGYTISEVWRYLRTDRTNFRRYISEVFDCDDFAQVLQGNANSAMPGVALGTIWYGGRGWGHAVNIFFCHRANRCYLIEPQNDRIYMFNKRAWKPWMVIL